MTMTATGKTEASPAPRTIYTTYRTHSRFSRVRLRRPGPRPRFGDRITALFPSARIPGEAAEYTPELALELLARTADFPESKRALFLILSEYGHALHNLATQALAAQGDAPASAR
jgi:hypothetical protein